MDAIAADLDEARAGSGDLGRQSALSDEDRTLIGTKIMFKLNFESC